MKAHKANKRRANSSRRNSLRRYLEGRDLVCYLCGRPLDYSLPAGLPASPEIDEVLPVSKGGDPLDVSNCRMTHRYCNEFKGNRPAEEAKRILHDKVKTLSLNKSTSFTLDF